MRLLCNIDLQDYAHCTRTYRRDSARGIILRLGKVAMIHSRRDGYYKFPGGGIEQAETPEAAMIREVREEAGLIVCPDSVQEYGCVHRIQCSPGNPEEIFIQDNFYYLCEIAEELGQKLDDYEAEEGFTPEFVDPRHAIETNLYHDHSGKESPMFPREAGVLQWLIDEGYFG